MTTCDSSLLSAFEYDNNAWTLTVVFRSNNSVRTYGDVPPELFSEFVSAKSVGSFYNQRIKGKFESVKGNTVTDEQVAEAVADKNFAPSEAHVAPLKNTESDLGITDEDIRSADPAYKSAEELAAQPEILSPDQAVAVLSPKNPQADRLTTELHKLAAVKIEVKDGASQAEMEDHLVKLTTVRKAVFDIIDPYREIAYRAYEAVQKLNKGRLDPADVAIKAGKQVLGVYLAAEQEKARVEQRRLQAEAEAEAAKEQARQTEALRLQVASEHQERGDTAAAEASLFDETIQAAPVQVYAPRAEAPTSSLGGRANWKGEITDMDEVILDAAEGIKSLRAGKGLLGHVPITVLQGNDPGIKALANANKTMFRFPGMRAWDDRVITTTKKKGQ